MILPRNNGIWTDYAFCGWHFVHGNGEMTGIPWIDESGMLGSPVGITNTHQVGWSPMPGSLRRGSRGRRWIPSAWWPETFDAAIRHRLFGSRRSDVERDRKSRRRSVPKGTSAEAPA